MVYVPGGTFTMGLNGRDGGDEYERPAHQVTVKPFFMDSYEVTNEDYAKFIKETSHQQPPTWTNQTYPSGAARKPVTSVTWDDARDYAAWAKKRLPTEEEWEFAARGTDNRRYPWGNEWRAGSANADGAASGMVDVGTYKGTSPFGAFDLVGNAWEWTDSELKAYPGGQLPLTPASDTKVLRGGSYKSNKAQATATYRLGWRASGEASYAETGFRCVSDIAAASATP
jgi:serine/threonine-protein kinase